MLQSNVNTEFSTSYPEHYCSAEPFLSHKVQKKFPRKFYIYTEMTDK